MATTKRPASLTYKQLSAHDDVITDAIIDHVYFWTTIRKNHIYYRPERTLNEGQIADIVQKQVVLGEDVKEAVQQLLSLTGIRKYLARLPKGFAADHFSKHLEKYVQIYLPDCPFEVTTTNRYTITELEAAVTARKPIKRGAIIKYLCGTMVSLTHNDEAELDFSKRSFSIVHSSRKKTMSLFLGPARLANHDCQPNSRLTSLDSNKMEVTALESIGVNEEITVSYGDDYFGVDNCECLCATCERLGRNGWATEERPTIVRELSSSVDVLDPWGYSLRSQREKRKIPLEFMVTPEFAIDDSVHDSRQRKSASSTPKPQRIADATQDPAIPSLVDDEDSTMKPEPKPAKPLQMPLLRVPDVAEESDCASSTLANVFNSPHSTPATSVSEEEDLLTKTSNDQAQPPTSITTTEIVLSTTETDVLTELHDTTITNVVSSISEETTYTIHPEVASTVDKVDIQIVQADPIEEPKVIEKSRTSRYTVSVTETTKRKRTPGDYLIDKSLLSKPASKKLICSTCDDSFIQENAYEPRADCPRCERHSKLHGFSWPKSRRVDENDKEIRYLDHRQINRTLGPKSQAMSSLDTGLAVEDSSDSRPTKKKKLETKAPLKGGIWKGWVPFEQEWKQMKKESKKASSRAVKKPKSKKVSASTAAKPKGVSKTSVASKTTARSKR